jgi:hypothetical protein
MKWFHSHRIVASLAPVLPLLIAANFNYHSYRPYSLQRVIKEQQHLQGGDFNIVASDFKYKVAVQYLGEHRPIRSHVHELIRMWAKAVRPGPDVPAAFKREIHVKEAGIEYWLPIQEVLRPDLEKECRSACAADLYVMWIGSAKGDWVFIVNDFQVQE